MLARTALLGTPSAVPVGGQGMEHAWNLQRRRVEFETIHQELQCQNFLYGVESGSFICFLFFICFRSLFPFSFCFFPLQFIYSKTSRIILKEGEMIFSVTAAVDIPARPSALRWKCYI